MKVRINRCSFERLKTVYQSSAAHIVIDKDYRIAIYTEKRGTMYVLKVNLIPKDFRKFGLWLQKKICVVYEELRFKRLMKSLTGVDMLYIVDMSAYMDYQWPRTCYSYDKPNEFNSLAGSVVSLHQLHYVTNSSMEFCKFYAGAQSVLVNICYSLRVPYPVYKFVRSILLRVMKPKHRLKTPKFRELS